MKSKIIIAGLAVMLGLSGLANAQCKEWNWGDNPDVSKEKYVLHNDLVKAEQYKEAIPAHNWLLENTPDLQRAIYINGEKIYSKLADDEKDEAQKAIYVDSLMLIYDMRIKYCGETASVLDRKALYAMKYYGADKEKAAWVLSVYDTLFDVANGDVMDANLKYYMTSMKVNKFYLDNLSDEDILNRYDKIMKAVVFSREQLIKKGKSTAKLDAIEKDVNETLGELVKLDCDKTKELFGPKFEADPEDIATAERIFSFMLIGKCTDDPLWLAAGKAIFTDKPDYGLAKNIGLKDMANEDYESANYYFGKAMELAQSDDQKADIETQLGHIERKKGNFTSARSHYRSAASYGNTEAYSYIGIMYMGSFETCAGKVSKVDDRAVFIAAYKMFQLAGDSKRMSEAKSQFPSVGEIFEEDKKKGDAIRVGCWINETVSLDTRD